MEFAATALRADDSYRSSAWVGVFDGIPRADVPETPLVLPRGDPLAMRETVRTRSCCADTRTVCPMTGVSILFVRPDDRTEPQHAPACFVDLNLDQIVDAVTEGWADYNLKPFFHAPLNRIDAIAYRHEVFQDLENPELLEHVRSFAQSMREVRAHLAQAEKLYYQHQKEAWFLYAVEIYCGAVEGFSADLSTVTLKSRGFRAFRDYLTGYAAGRDFISRRGNAHAGSRLVAGAVLRPRQGRLLHSPALPIRD